MVTIDGKTLTSTCAPDSPYKYENSQLPGSSVADELAESGDDFFNPTDPQVALKHERPAHRLAILLKAQGLSNKEIAERLGLSAIHVGNILRQPWARKRLVEEIQRSGRDEIQALLAGSAVDSINTLIELRDDDEVENSVRKAAADSLLDRFLGKPTQRVESKNETHVFSGDVARIDQELAEFEAEEKRLQERISYGDYNFTNRNWQRRSWLEPRFTADTVRL